MSMSYKLRKKKQKKRLDICQSFFRARYVPLLTNCQLKERPKTDTNTKGAKTMQEMFADLHVHIGRSENGKPIKITAARSLNFANIAKECADRKGIQIVGIIDCASPYVIEDIENFKLTCIKTVF